MIDFLHKLIGYFNDFPTWVWFIFPPFVVAVTSLYVHKAKIRFDAAKAFRSSFNSELTELRELCVTETGQVWDILRAAYPRHEEAFEEYKRNLGFFQRWWLSRRWMKYRGPYPKPPELPSEDQRYRLARYIGSDIESELQKREIAIRAIERLLN